MICTESANAVFGIVDRATKMNIGFRALDNSILGACVVASQNYTVDNYHQPTGFVQAWQDSLMASPVFGIKSAVTITDAVGEQSVIIPTTVHSKTMDDASDIIAEAARTAMNHAQNVATPIIGQLIDDINDAMEGAEGFAEKYEIIEVTPDGAWNSPIVITALGNYSSFTSPKMVSRSEIPHITIPTDYMPEIRTGSTSIDALINDMLSGANMTITDVIGSIFNGNGDAGAYPEAYWRDSNIDLLKFLTCQWLISNPIPNCGMGGSEWSTITNRLSTAYGSLCNLIKGMLDRDVKELKLFYFHDEATDKIYVNGPVYDQWLNAGGTPELIFGCLMNGDYSQLTFADTIENSTKLMHVWTATHTALNNANRQKREANLREASFNAVLNAIETLDPSQYGPSDSKLAMVNRARVVVTGMCGYDLNNLDKTAIAIVCDVLFPHTPSKCILNDVNDQLNNDVSMDNAILDAITTYITNWVTGSIIVVNNN